MKITVYVSTNKVGSACNQELEFEDGEWEEMSDLEKEKACKDAIFELIEWGFTPSEEFKPNIWNS